MDPATTHAEVVRIATYDAEHGLRGWHEREEIVAVGVTSDGAVTISANEHGLRGLARELLGFAQTGVPDGEEVYLMSKGQAPILASGSPSLR